MLLLYTCKHMCIHEKKKERKNEPVFCHNGVWIFREGEITLILVGTLILIVGTHSLMKNGAPFSQSQLKVCARCCLVTHLKVSLGKKEPKPQ